MSETHTNADIAALIPRVALGDRAAFTRLYDATSAKLFGTALRILKQRAEAEEAVQEIYLKIWQRAGQYQQSAYSPMSWLIAIARNHALDTLRARRPVSDDIDKVLDHADDGPNPEQATMASSERQQIDFCLNKLDPDKANAVRGAYLDGFTYEELANRYATPLNTMRTWLRRSLLQLRDCLTS